MSDTGKIIAIAKAVAGGTVDPSAIESAVYDWLDDHPEATTTVEDGSITKAKLDEDLQETVDDVNDLKSAIDNLVDVEDSTPSDPAVKIWFPATAPSSIQVPTYSEHQALVSAVAEKYEKPSGGIPSTDMASAVQTSLGKADSAYQKPSGGIPSTDMTTDVQTSLGKADTAYQKPSGGIPSTDIASGVIPDVSGFYTKPISGIPSSDMTNEVQTSLGKADTAYQKPASGIPETDIKETAFRLIKEVTTVADQGYVYINTDSDGESFSLKEMIIEANILACNNSVTGFIVPNKADNYNIGNYAWLGLYNFTSNSSEKKTIAHIEVKGGKFFGESNGDSFSQYYTTARKYTSAMAMGTQDCDPISSIGIGGIGGTVFGTGSTIKVYGR